MKVKLNTLVNPLFNSALCKLMKRTSIPPKVQFRLRSIAKAVGGHVSKYEEIRKNYVEQFAERDGDGKMIVESLGDGGKAVKLLPGKSQEVSEKLKELGDQFVEIKEIQYDELDVETQSSMAAEDLYQLEFIVE